MHSRAMRNRAAQRGFTLLEILVVVVIIGIVVIGAILSLGATGRDSGLQQERDRLEALIAYGRERGAMLTLEYGIRCGQHGYRFVFYDNRLMRWSPEMVDDTLRPRQLPAGLALQLQVEGKPIVLDDKALKVNPLTAVPPPGMVSLPGGGSSGSGLSSLSGSGGISGALGAGGPGSSGLGTGVTGLGSSAGAGSGYGSSSGSIGPSGSLGGGGSGSSDGGGLGIGNAGDENAPQIMLFSNGDTNTFLLTMVREGVGRSVTFQSSDDGTVKVGDIKEAKDATP